MQSLAVSERQFEYALVGGEDENVVGGIENGGTDFAVLEVLLHDCAHFRREIVVEKLGDVIPDVLAVAGCSTTTDGALRASRNPHSFSITR